MLSLHYLLKNNNEDDTDSSKKRSCLLMQLLLLISYLSFLEFKISDTITNYYHYNTNNNINKQIAIDSRSNKIIKVLW